MNHRRVSAAACLALVFAAACPAAPPSPGLQKRVRSATFEVVLRKAEKDTLTYEKPLPLELIPFAQRNDAYWSIGSAFALAPGTFASAGHVMLAGVESIFGIPAIRDSQGHVYPVDQVLKFSLHEDFIVFTVKGATEALPLPTSSAFAIDDAVFAVGNALGEGVVIRDGLLTSLTPEAQDGRWKWLRFSAAASPGNSGGPLLDTQGRVIGIVIGASPGENLNYALPIERVLLDPGNAARFDVREAFSLPILHGSTVAHLESQFALPLSYPEFSRRVHATLLDHHARVQRKLLAERADSLFPKGDSAKLLAKVHRSFEPSIVVQKDDLSWDVKSGIDVDEIDLPDGGSVWTGQAAGSLLFRIKRPEGATDAKLYADSRSFMDLLLKCSRLPRFVGTEPVYITSLGAAQREEVVRDGFGRAWQLRTWSMQHVDIQAAVLALPTPDGYVGIGRVVQSAQLERSIAELRLLADYFYVSYSGTLPQWRAFLARREWRPPAFDEIRIEYEAGEAGKGFYYESPRLRLDVPRGVLAVDDRSTLDLQMTYIVEKGKVGWDVGAVVVKQDPDKNTYVAAYRQPKPADGAGKELLQRWEDMSKRTGEFDGVPEHDSRFRNFWVRAVLASEATSNVLYEVTSNTEGPVQPRVMTKMHQDLLKAVRVTER